MKIYDTTGIKLSVLESIELQGKFLCKVDNLPFHSLIQVNGRVYTQRMIGRVNGCCAVEETDLVEGSTEGDEECGYEFVCPHCASVDSDAWELDDNMESEIQCNNCGATLYFSKEVEITYTVKLVKKPEIINL